MERKVQVWEKMCWMKVGGMLDQNLAQEWEAIVEVGG
jgi:hypothetical protein